MIVSSIYGGFASQWNKYMISLRIALRFDDRLVLDLSEYALGYFMPYVLDHISIPKHDIFVHRGTKKQKIATLEKEYNKKVILVQTSDDLLQMYENYNYEYLYYLISDGYIYESICDYYPEFSMRYIGDDPVTKKIVSYIEPLFVSDNVNDFKKHMQSDRVGVHIRLRDFINYGWMVEEDYGFYRAGIQWFRENYRGAEFYIFSDDIKLAERILGIANDIKYIDFEDTEYRDIEEFLCLSYCKHMVLTKASGYGKLADTIHQIRLKEKKISDCGIKVIIDKIALAKEADNKSYFDETYNKGRGYYGDHQFGMYCSLNKMQIADLNSRYMYREKPKILFLTYHYYDEFLNEGMQYVASELQKKGYEVHFVGEKTKNKESVIGVEDTLDKQKIATNKRGENYGYYLYPYVGLQSTEDYNEFIEKLRDGKEIIVITRKPLSVPEKNKERDSIKYVFVDFTERCEKENNSLDIDELNYLYDNCDKVVTFDSDVFAKLDKKLANVSFIEIDRYFPQFRFMSGYTDKINRIFYNKEFLDTIEQTIVY